MPTHLAHKSSKKITARGLSVWSIAALFFLYEFFSRTFIGTLATHLMHTFSLTPLALSLLGSAYYLAYALMQVPVGLLVDSLGVKKTLSVAVLVCTLGLLLFAHAHSFDVLLLGRVAMGLGSSFAFVSLLILALNWFPKQHFGFFAGATQILGAAGPMMAGAPLVLLLHHAHGNWRSVLDLVVALGVFLFLLIVFFVRNHPTTTHVIKNKAKQIPTLRNLSQLLNNSTVWSIACYAFCTYAAISVLGAILGTYFLQRHGLSRDTAANLTSFLWLGLGIGSPIVGYLSDRWHARRQLMILCALLGLITICFILLWPGQQPSVFAGLYFILGVSGSAQTLSFAALAQCVKGNQRATAMGLNNTAVMLGGSLVPPIIGSIMSTYPNHLALSFISLPLLYLIGLYIAYKKLH